MKGILKKAMAAALVAVMVLSMSGCTEEEQPQTNQPQQEQQQDDGQQPETQQEQEEQSQQQTVTAPSLSQQLKEAKAKNDDIIGWLKIDDLKVDGAVVQAENNTKYERLNEWGQYSWTGTYFADYECSFGTRDDLSPNTIIYGHSDLTNNPDGPRFSELFRFTEEDFARSTPVITFATQEDWMDWEVFAVAEYSTDPRLIQPEPEGGIAALAADVRKESVFDYDVQVGDGDHILTLITCTDDTAVRLVVMARLLDSDAELPAAAPIASSDETSQEV